MSFRNIRFIPLRKRGGVHLYESYEKINRLKKTELHNYLLEGYASNMAKYDPEYLKYFQLYILGAAASVV
jgi:hypothetical protein